MLQTNTTNSKRDLTPEDIKILRKHSNTPGFIGDLSKNVLKQGWISDKQRMVLHRGTTKYNPPRRSSRYNEDYDESAWEITDYELCIGAYGD